MRHARVTWRMNWRGPALGTLVCAVLIRAALGAPVAWASAPAGSPQTDVSVRGPAREVPTDDVSALIRQLGSADYARRESAQARLRSLGLKAFDELYQAQASADLEIAFRARYLVRSLTIRWARDDDPAPVRELLRGYGEKSEDDRRSLSEQLVKLPDNQGVAAVCRIVRFEASELLSKRAALDLMQAEREPDQASAAHVAEIVSASLDTSCREASGWLRLYVQTLRDPLATLSDWEAISTREEEAFQKTASQETSDVVRDLLRWRAGLLEQVGRRDESLAVILKTIDLLDGTRRSLLEAVDWLGKRQAWPAISEVAERYPERFRESTLLLYRLAEAQVKSQLDAKAQQTVELARQANPDDLREHLLAAYVLQERGLLEWSEREYRLVTQRAPPGEQDGVGLQARLFFSEMLHDLEREHEAADVLREVVDAMEKDQKVRYLVARSQREPESLASRMHYFVAEQARLAGDRATQVESLKKAIQSDPTDVDALIGAYRASEREPQWREETVALLGDAAKVFRDEAREIETQMAEAPTEDIRAMFRRELATAYNQLAWLISNTEGDYDEALRVSHRSLELRPDTAAYLDTLGRCYYAKGDYKNAVGYQTRAVELEPHSSQIRRQLQLFQQALDLSLTKSEK